MKKKIIILLCTAILPYYSMAEEKSTGDRILATYKGGEVKESQVINAINTSFQGQSPLKDKKFSDLDKQIQQDLIKSYVSKALIEQAAANSDVEKSKEFQDKLAETKKQMVVQEYLSQYFKKNITEALLDEEYQKIVQSLKGKKEIKVWHILVNSEEEAKKIKNQLDSGKVNFDNLAKKNSIDDTSKNSGGLIGYVREGATVPEFEKAVFSTPSGKISAPVKTQFGWHIIKIGEKRDIPIPSKEQAKMDMSRRVQQELVNKLVTDLNQKSDVKILVN